MKSLVSHSEAQPPGLHTWTHGHCSPRPIPTGPASSRADVLWAWPPQKPLQSCTLLHHHPLSQPGLHGARRPACLCPSWTGSSRPPSGQGLSQDQTSSQSNAARLPSLLPTGGPVWGEHSPSWFSRRHPCSRPSANATSPPVSVALKAPLQCQPKLCRPCLVRPPPPCTFHLFHRQLQPFYGL